jgi:hypothetical protein
MIVGVGRPSLLSSQGIDGMDYGKPVTKIR